MAFGRVPQRIAGAVLLVAALASASAARAASPEDRAAARKHTSQAQELQKQGRVAEACQHWQEVERLDPKLPALMELAECTEQLGQVVEAQAYWTMARERAKHDEKPQSKARAEAKLAAVQKRVAQLTLQLAPGTPAGAQVLCDDQPLEPASLGQPRPMNPGAHVIVVKLAGHDDAKLSVTLADAAQQTLALSVGPASTSGVAAAPASAPPPPPVTATAAPAVPPAPPPPAPAPVGWWSGPHQVGVLAGAVGLAAIGGGSVLCVTAKRSTDTRLLLGGVSLATGGVLLVSGLVLLASGPAGDVSSQARATFRPTLLVARDAAVLGAAGTF
jgi:hypothetical protein